VAPRTTGGHARTSRRAPSRRPPASGRAEGSRRQSGAVIRARLLVVGSVVASALVLAAWFPASALLHQRHDLSATTAQLKQLQAQDQALAQERRQLSSPAEISRLARQQYQLVAPGQKAYEVLPRSGTATGAYGGDPGLQPPVAPSATSELPPGTATSGTANQHRTGPLGGSGTPGLLSRIARTLEFWR
jgi:cell division protein FtsB